MEHNTNTYPKTNELKSFLVELPNLPEFVLDGLVTVFAEYEHGTADVADVAPRMTLKGLQKSYIKAATLVALNAPFESWKEVASFFGSCVNADETRMTPNQIEAFEDVLRYFEVI